MRVLFRLPVRVTWPGAARQRSCSLRLVISPTRGGGVVEQYEQHPVPAGLARGAGERGKDGPRFGLGEVLDRCSRAAWCFQGLGCLAERDQGDVLVRAVGQERLDGAEPEPGRCRRVVPLRDHPRQPGFEVLPLEVVEADLGAVDVLDAGEVVDEAFQADPVGLDRPGRVSLDGGQVGVQVVAGEPVEVRGVGARVAFHSNPTSGRIDSLSAVITA